jgi:hydrogenase maturation protease
MGNIPKASIVVGIGNPMLKDDRVGIEVVEALKARNSRVETAILYSVGFDVLDTIMGYEEAVIVDACQMGMAPGTVKEITPEEIFDHEKLANSHAVTLGSILETGQILFPDQMPKKLKLILVEVEDISTFSTQCTPVVCHAIYDVVERIQTANKAGQL